MATGLGLLVGAVAMLAGLLLPVAPVLAEQTAVRWPVPGEPTVSSTAFLAPYRPAALTAEVPCAAIRAAAAAPNPVTVLATEPDGTGLLVRVAGGSTHVLLNGHLVASAPATSPDCGVTVTARAGDIVVTPGGRADEPVPAVAEFRTDLDPAAAAGITVTARTSNPFDPWASDRKRLLIVLQLVAAAVALALLARSGAARSESAESGAARSGRGWWLDVGVVVVLAGWAVIGPLSDDDGFATMIARNSAVNGDVGNYYRWWNASEAPFALVEHVLATLTPISIAPLWLRLPSTLLGVATWLLVGRGVLRAAAPRWLAAVCFLACWLPFNLGVRPEAYVACGVTAVLALLGRARGPGALGLAALVAALTLTTSPSGVLVLAPILVCGPRIVRILRAGSGGRWGLAARVLLLGGVAATALTVVFADQAWSGVVTATRWHTTFGPSLAWYQEFERYRYLLSDDQDGGATKRLPVLVTLALLPVVGLLLARRPAAGLGAADREVARLAGVAALGLALLWLTPSKWTHHFGSLAGVFTAFLAVAATLVVHRARAGGPDRVVTGVGLAGGGLVAVAAGVAFAGPNAWWQPVVYDVPWAAGPVRPAGIPLDSPLLWAAAVGVGYLVVRARRGAARVPLVAAPALVAVGALAASVAVLLGSFLAAPLRQPAGSLALANLRQLTGQRSCGLADDVQVLPDVPGGVLAPTGPEPDRAVGFTAGAGYDPGAPPPEPPGVGASARLWGSRTDGPASTGDLTSQWFGLPPVGPDREVAVTVAGRTDGGNSLALEFGRSTPGGVIALGERIPPDPVRAGQEHRLWRSVGVAADDIPPDTDRVRVRAVDATSDPDGWLAVTGPRLRQVVGLTDFLAAHGPVLVSWPLAFLFPCLADRVAVRAGVAEAPASVLEAPRHYAGLSAASTDPAIGGDFAPLRGLGNLGEETSRLAGHPELDWGSVLLAHYPSRRDAYRLEVTRGPG